MKKGKGSEPELASFETHHSINNNIYIDEKTRQFC